MTVRARGFWILLGSAVAGFGLYWLLFHLLPTATGTVRVPFALGLPIVGIIIGLVELITGIGDRNPALVPCTNAIVQRPKGE